MSESEGGFVANYPPFSCWSAEGADAARAVLAQAPADPSVPLGLYVHVPFCRKRCRFCYFKVQTETPSAEVRAYVGGLAREAALYAQAPFVAGRPLHYVYVGGGTPSYLSGDQIRELFGAIRGSFALRDDAEITFECEPGTVREAKIVALKELGVTRVSLGVETWDDELLKLNGRAHEAKHILPAMQLCRDIGIPQVNLDLIAGMVGETDGTWADGIQRTIDVAPDSVTIYQLEIPRNTALWRGLQGQEDLGGPIADVPTRRRWAREAFEALQRAGYTMTSGYTAVRGDPTGRFVYRDRLWKGADMLPLGVSSFGHVAGVHLQNDKNVPTWLASLDAGHLPIHRGYVMSPDEQLVRQLVLQLKLGRVDASWFRDKFGVDPLRRFSTPLDSLVARRMLTVDGDRIEATWDGLMQVDRWLTEFFLPEHRADAA